MEAVTEASWLGEADWARWGMRRGSGVALRGTGGGDAEWGGRMGMATQGGNCVASIGARGQGERIGALGERLEASGAYGRE